MVHFKMKGLISKSAVNQIVKLGKPVTLLTISSVVTRVIAMIFFIILARNLPVANYGLFRYLITLSMTYAIFFTGFTYAMTKFISEKPTKKNRSQIFTNALLLSLIFVVITILAVILFNDNKAILIIFILAAYIDFFYIGLVRGLLDYRKLAGYKLVENIFQLVALIIFFAFFSKFRFETAVLLYFLSTIVSVIFFEVFWKSEILFSIEHVSRKILGRLLKFTIPVFLGSVGWSIMFGINEIIIKNILNTESVAYFSVATTICQVFTFLPLAISTILLPKVSKNRFSSHSRSMVNIAVIGNLAFSALLLVVILPLRMRLVQALFGPQYLAASMPIVFLSLGQIFITTYTIYTSLFQGLNAPTIPSVVVLVTGCLNVIGSLLLTGVYGVSGAAISNMVTCFIAMVLVMFFYYSRKWK